MVVMAGAHGGAAPLRSWPYDDITRTPSTRSSSALMGHPLVPAVVSNAEEMSSKASTIMLPFLRERNRSLTTFRRAVSVL